MQNLSELSRKQRKELRRQKATKELNGKELNQNKDRLKTNSFSLKPITPLTQNQALTFEQYNAGYNLMLHGMAGTGKTFISLYLGLRDVLVNQNYESVTLVRSVVPTRDMGFLPGSQKEKSMVYEGPYYPIVNSLFGRGDAYEIMKNKHTINFTTTSFIRGITIDDSVVIIDEMQNMNWGELDSIITRIGNNCKVIFCGDFRQTDFQKNEDKNGLMKFMSVIERMKDFAYVEFTQEDIVRSALVKDYIISKTNLGFS